MPSEIMRIILVVAVMGVAVVGVIAVAQNQPGGSNSADTSVPTVNEHTGDSNVCVVFFYDPDCPHCDNVEAYLDRVTEQRNITVKRHNVETQSSARLLYRYYERYDVPNGDRGGIPIVFVGGDYAVGDKPAISLIYDTLATGKAVACPAVNQSAQATPTG